MGWMGCWAWSVFQACKPWGEGYLVASGEKMSAGGSIDPPADFFCFLDGGRARGTEARQGRTEARQGGTEARQGGRRRGKLAATSMACR